ncbi:MAG: hypothetical protein HEP71_11685 [Roseivirga sp.]|nr:hypothetical protein [Roseivirga sp.]
MKIFAICNSDQLGLPTVVRLKELDFLVGVSYVERYVPLIHSFKSIGIADEKIYSLSKENWVNSLQEAISELKPDYVFVLTFPWKIPSNLLNLLPGSFINFHFGLLPKYKGADPIFWEVKNYEPEGGLTVHVMNEEIDEGAVIMQEKAPIGPGISYGLYCNQLTQSIGAWTDALLNKLQTEPLQFLELEAGESAPDRSPTQTDLTINWAEQTALEIENLVNAANPRYGGAITTFAGQPLRILEVTPMGGNDDMKGQPGEIVHADLTYGIIVICADGEFLRVSVAEIAGAYISGIKLTTFGFFKGAKFG